MDKKNILLILMLILGKLDASAMEDKEANEASYKHPMAFQEEKDIHDFTELSPLMSILPVPGIYKSEDIEVILSLALYHFTSNDIVMFDVDEALMTGYGLFYQEISKKYKDFYKVIIVNNKPIGDNLVQYMLSRVPSVLMDKRTPDLIKKLQSKEVKCIANTSLDPLINKEINLDLPSARVHTLRSFGIDFSQTFSDMRQWTFETIQTQYIGKDTPLFKEGIIFSAQTPKPITTYELFKKRGLKPQRILFIDDSAENIKGMFNFFLAKDIECYSVLYSKKNQPLKEFFDIKLFNHVVQDIENFFNRLLIEKEAEGILQKIDGDV